MIKYYSLEEVNLMNLKEESTYKKLQLKFLALMTIFKTRLAIGSPTIESDVEEILKNLKEIKKGVEEGLLDLRNIMIIDELSSETTVLKRKYSRNCMDIHSIEQDISFLQMQCINIPSFLIEMMEFIVNHQKSLETETYGIAVLLMRDILMVTPYERTSRERIYLTQKYPHHLWYDAYCIRNASVPKEEHTFLLNNLLKTVLLSPISDKHFTRSIKGHLNKETCGISETAYNSLLRCSDDRRPNVLSALFAIASNGTNPPISSTQYIDDFVESIEKRYFSAKAFIDLFETMHHAYPNEYWLDYYVRRMVEFGEETVDKVLAYIKQTHINLLLLVEDEIALYEADRNEKRLQLIETLKQIAAKK